MRAYEEYNRIRGILVTMESGNLADGYCMRTKLLDEASTFLSEADLKTLRA